MEAFFYGELYGLVEEGCGGLVGRREVIFSDYFFYVPFYEGVFYLFFYLFDFFSFLGVFFCYGFYGCPEFFYFLVACFFFLW